VSSVNGSLDGASSIDTNPEEMAPPAVISVSNQKWCDGIPHCGDASDETFPECNVRFFCTALDGRISIARNEVCDGIIDCDDGSDESIAETCPERFNCSSQGGAKVHVSYRMQQSSIHKVEHKQFF